VAHEPLGDAGTDAGRIDERVDLGAVAVVAHGLLNSMAAVLGGIDTARRIGDLDHDCDRMLAMASRQSVFVIEVLKDLVLGLPAEVVAHLDSLDAAARVRRADEEGGAGELSP
jgi:hypothetical protein